MKHFYTKALLILVTVFAFDNIANADYTTYTFINKNPKTEIECLSDNILEFMKEFNETTEVSEINIDDIECNDIFLKVTSSKPNNCGLILRSNKDENKIAYLKLKFNPKNLFKATRIIIIGYSRDISASTNTNLTLKYNENNIDFSLTQTYTTEKTNNEIESALIAPSILLKTLNSGVINPIEALSELELILNPSQNNTEYQLLGIRIYYNEVVDLSEVETAVEDLEVEQGIRVYEYYDLMGRRLAEAPQSGVYVRKCGGKVEKLIANGR